MIGWFYRFVFSATLLFCGVGFYSDLFAQEVEQTPWISFEQQIDSLIEKGFQNEAFLLLTKREKEFIQEENWEEALLCINKYGRLIETQNPDKRAQKIKDSRWLIAKIGKPSKAKADFIQQIGENFLSYKGNKDSSIFYLQWARDDFYKLKSWEGYTYSSIIIGINHYYDGKYQEAENWFLPALDSAQTHLDKDNSAIPTTLGLLVLLYNTTGDFGKSLFFNKKSQEAYEQMESMTPVDSQYLGNLYNTIGNTFMEMEDYQQALSYFQQAKFLNSHLSQVDSIDVQTVILNEGIVYWKLGQKEKAMSLWESILPQMEDMENFQEVRLITFAYSYLSEYALDKGEYQKAIDYLNKSMELESIEKGYEMVALREMGYLYLKMGKMEEAYKWMNRALAKANEVSQGRNLQISRSHIGLADYYIRVDQKKKALAQYQLALIEISDAFADTSPQAQPAIREVQDKALFLKLLQGKAQLCRNIYEEEADEKWLNLSAEVYDLAISLIDSIRTSIRTEGSKLRFAEVAHQVYDGAIQVALMRHASTQDVTLLKEAFSYAEKNKGLSLRDALQDSDAKQFAGIPPELLERENKLKTEISFYQKKIFDGKNHKNPDHSKIALWQSKHFELRKAFLALVDTLEKAYPAYYELKYRDESIHAEAIMGKLKKGSALVEYFWGSEELVIFCLTSDVIEVFTQPLDENFQHKLSEFRSVATQKPSENAADFLRDYKTFSQNGYELYQQLLEPFMANHDVHDLLIIPDGILGHLTFEVLITSLPPVGNVGQFAQLPYLFKNCKVRYEYAASFMEHTYAGKGKGLIGFAPEYGKQPGAFSAPSSRGNWRPLLYNQDELEQVNHQISGKTYLGKEATKSRFLAEASSYAILHLAMHGFINDQNPLYSGLVFSQESEDPENASFGFLHAYELYNLSLKAELAVLSACNTGTGRLAKGEGIMSMARAFRYAGCPSIVMSLWTADDRATIRLMEFFYQYLEEGFEKHEALQKARIAYLGSTRRDHPYYWAGFVLIGDEGVLSTNATSKNYFWIAGGIFLVLLSLIGIRQAIRKRKF